jgi:hypothetical protein
MQSAHTLSALTDISTLAPRRKRSLEGRQNSPPRRSRTTPRRCASSLSSWSLVGSDRRSRHHPRARPDVDRTSPREISATTAATRYRQLQQFFKWLVGVCGQRTPARLSRRCDSGSRDRAPAVQPKNPSRRLECTPQSSALMLRCCDETPKHLVEGLQHVAIEIEDEFRRLVHPGLELFFRLHALGRERDGLHASVVL